MNKLWFSMTLALAAPAAIAQNCFDGDFGTLIATNVQDWVSPIQSIGFPFPVGGVTYTDIHVSDHGLAYLSNAGVPVPPQSLDLVLYTPTAANFASGSPKVCCLYADVIASGGGRIYLNASASKCTVTWVNMQNFGIAVPRWDMQMTLYPSGDVRFAYGVGATNASTYGATADDGIVGVTPGGGVTLPTMADLSSGGVTPDATIYENWTVASTFDMANDTLLLAASNPGYAYVMLGAPANCAAASNYGTGCDGMGLGADGLPSLGNAGFSLTVTGVPAVSPVAFVGFGDTVVNPGADLTGIGMAGCFAYTNLNLGLFASGPVVSGQSVAAFGVPNNPTLVGALFSSQGVALSLATALNIAASNGTQFTVGYGN